MIYTNIIVEEQFGNDYIGEEIVEYKIPSLGDMLFDKVTIIPNIINVGVVASTYTFDLEVRNTTLTTVYITDISIRNGDGFQITLEEGSLDIRAGDFAKFKVSISPEGQSEIDAQIIFEINNDDQNVVFCQVNGSRVALFNYEINYAQPINEYYKHNTVITTSNDGSEFRSSISLNPRMSFDYYYTFTSEESTKVQNMIYDNQMKEIQVPLFQLKGKTLSAISAGDTTLEMSNVYLNIESGMSLMVKNGSDYDVMEIININGNVITFSNSFSFDYPEGTSVYPLMGCQINTFFTSEYQTNDLFNTLITFDVIDNRYKTILSNDDSGLPSYQGNYVLLRNPSRDVTFRKTNNRMYDYIDNGYGVRTRDVNDASPAITMTYLISLQGKEEINTFKVLFNKSKGRYHDFYVTSSTNDFKPSADVSTGSTSLRCKNEGQLIYNGNTNFNIVYILLKDGTEYYRNIQSIDFDGNDNILLTFNGTFERDILIEEFANIQFLTKARFNNDTLQISHLTDDYAEISIDVNIFRGK